MTRYTQRFTAYFSVFLHVPGDSVVKNIQTETLPKKHWVFLCMRKSGFILTGFIFSSLCLFSQPKPNYPNYYFRDPLGISPMEIVANYGELRPDHWHMGLDIRTNQKENYPVYAAAGGYISRIKVEKSGYGRSVYINHPNGLTTVYGHLNKFFPALEKYVTGEQYKNQSWEIDLNFDKKQFPVFKSQLIAYSGNTGSSQGPHLHFEIRNTQSTKCLNPLLFGFPMKDEIKPEIIRLALYDRSRSVYDQNPRLFSLEKGADDYSVSNSPVIQTGLKKISFAIQAVDRMKKGGSADGIYAAKLFLDNKPVTGFVLDSIDYNETAYMNAQIDYKLRYYGGVYVQHLSQLPGDHGVVYKPVNGNGVIDLADTSLHLVHIEVKDAYQNTSQLNFMIQYVDSLATPVLPDSTQRFAPNRVNVLERPDFEMFMPEQCLYDSARQFYNRKDNDVLSAVSAQHQVNDPSIPLHSSVSVRIKPNKEIPAALKDKIIIKRTDATGSSIRKAEWTTGWLSAKFGDFGNFQAFIDTIPPEIKNTGLADTIDYSSDSSIVMEAKDNFGAIKKFRGEIDGQWIRFTNDKGSPYVYNFDERCPYGVHELKITMEDQVGNISTKTFLFKRYPLPPKKKISKRNKGTRHKGQGTRNKGQGTRGKQPTTKNNKP